MQRVVSFLLAFVIFASAVGGAIIVVQAIRDEQKTASDQATDVDTNQTNDESSEEESTVNENQLKGKPLANFTASSDRISEVKIEDLTVGSGKTVETASQTVTAHYTGARVTDGLVFESSKDSGRTFTAPLTNLIQGWQTGMIGMKEGGVRRLTIPAALAYGDDASGGRPAGDLVFDIELITVE